MIEGNIKVSLHFGTIPATACGGPPPLTKGRLEGYRKKLLKGYLNIIKEYIHEN